MGFCRNFKRKLNNFSLQKAFVMAAFDTIIKGHESFPHKHIWHIDLLNSWGGPVEVVSIYRDKGEMPADIAWGDLCYYY